MVKGTAPRSVFCFAALFLRALRARRLSEMYKAFEKENTVHRGGERYDADDIRVCARIHKRPVRGPAIARAAGVPRAGRAHFHRQAQREGFRPPAVPGAAAKAGAGRRTGGAVHRPAGPQLRRDFAPVAADHKGKARRRRGAGHAVAGHAPDRPRFDGHVCGGSCAADPVVCGADRAREDPPAPERGHRGGRAAGRALRPPAQSGAAGLCPRERAVAVGADQLPPGGAGAARRAGHVFCAGQGKRDFPHTKCRVFRAGFLHTKGCAPETLSCVFSPRKAAGCTCAYYTPSERKCLLFRARLLRKGAFSQRGKAVAGRLFASGRKSGNRRKP